MNNLFEDDGFFDDEPVDSTSNTVNSGEADFLELVHRALDSKHSNFEFLRSAQDRTSAKIVRFSYATVSKMFKKLYESTYKTYLKQVELGDQDVETLMALKQFKHCMEFYDDEAKIVDDMLDEYSEYILSGHLLDMLLGRIRSEEDLWDHRGRGNNGK
jgi:hypothetical protein